MDNSHVTSLLLERLEHIPTDSVWAHRASGVRGSLLHIVEKTQRGEQVVEPDIKWLLAYGFKILENAAREKSLVCGLGKKKGP
jgi:hypothetical protein